MMVCCVSFRSVEMLYQVINQQLTLLMEPHSEHIITSDDGTMTSHYGVGYIPAGAENRPFIQDSIAAYALLRQEMQSFDPAKQYLIVVPNLADLQFVIRDRRNSA
jgi:hypothetical protein